MSNNSLRCEQTGNNLILVLWGIAMILAGVLTYTDFFTCAENSPAVISSAEISEQCCLSCDSLIPNASSRSGSR